MAAMISTAVASRVILLAFSQASSMLRCSSDISVYSKGGAMVMGSVSIYVSPKRSTAEHSSRMMALGSS